LKKSFDAAFASGECRRSLKTLASMRASNSSNSPALVIECQSAFNFDPASASNLVPPFA
jgi:hypothetical protein